MRISYQLCQLALDAPKNLHWRNVVNPTRTLYPEKEMPVRSEFSYRVDTHSATEKIYIVGFSRHVVTLIPNRERFLSGISYAIYVAAFGVEKDVAPGTAAAAAMRNIQYSPAYSDSVTSDVISSSLDRKEADVSVGVFTKAFSYDLSNIPPVRKLVENINLTEISDLKHIADGSHSHILGGNLKNRPVVIKILKETSVDNRIAVHEYDVEREILSRINHPNVIEIIGWGVFPRKFLVLEWLGGETLGQILDKHVSKSGIKIFQKPSFTYLKLLQLGRSFANAMDYLHNHAIVGATILHRDLKPDNITFTAGGDIKLIDFGLCTCVKSRDSLTEFYEMTGNTGSKRYMAPEVALKNPYNELADVYSFGIILWQMARDKIPYSKLSVADFTQKVVVNGERPKLDKVWPECFSALLATCWSSVPSSRPSFANIVQIIESLIVAEGGTLVPLPVTKPSSQPVFMKSMNGNPSISRSASTLVASSPSQSASGRPKSERLRDGMDSLKKGWF